MNRLASSRGMWIDGHFFHSLITRLAVFDEIFD